MPFNRPSYPVCDFPSTLFTIDTECSPHIPAFARGDVHVEIIRLDSEGLLYLELVVGIMWANVKVLEDL